jgi:hypothetical protein
MWGRKRKKTPKLSREESLGAKVVRNPEVNERTTDAGNLELTITLQRARWTRLLGQSPDIPVVRKYELDGMGRYVWEQCDRPATVEQLIRRFSKDHRINLREAEISVSSFLQMLMKRGLIGIRPAKSPTKEQS